MFAMDTTELNHLYSQLGTHRKCPFICSIFKLSKKKKKIEDGLGLVAVFAPWLPTAANRARLVARDRLIQIIEGVIAARRANADSSAKYSDLLQVLSDTRLPDGSLLPTELIPFGTSFMQQNTEKETHLMRHQVLLMSCLLQRRARLWWLLGHLATCFKTQHYCTTRSAHLLLIFFLFMQQRHHSRTKGNCYCTACRWRDDDRGDAKDGQGALVHQRESPLHFCDICPTTSDGRRQLQGVGHS